MVQPPPPPHISFAAEAVVYLSTQFLFSVSLLFCLSASLQLLALQ